MKRRNLLSIFALAVVSIATLPLGSNKAYGQEPSNDIVGVWEAVNVPAENDCTTGEPLPETPTIRVLNTFNQGGTGWLEDNAPFDGPYRSTGATIWKRNSGRSYSYLNLHYTFNPDKSFVFTISQRSDLTLSKDGDSFTEKGTFNVMIADGTVIYSGCFRAESRRIKF